MDAQRTKPRKKQKTNEGGTSQKGSFVEGGNDRNHKPFVKYQPQEHRSSLYMHGTSDTGTAHSILGTIRAVAGTTHPLEHGEQNFRRKTQCQKNAH